MATDKKSYYQGEYMEFNYTSLTSVGISKDEFIRVYPEDVTNYYSSSQNVFSRYIHSIGDYGNPTGLVVVLTTYLPHPSNPSKIVYYRLSALLESDK